MLFLCQKGFGGGTSGGSLFGTPAASTGMFGSNTQPTAPSAGTTGMFGAATNTGFGAQAELNDVAEPIKAAPPITPTEERPALPDSRPDHRMREELDDSLTVLKIRRPTVAFFNQSTVLERSAMLDETGVGEGEVTVAEEISETAEEEIMPPHPAGIVLRRCGHTTIPTMEELAIKGLDENGKCIVTSFSIIRKGYGQIFFEGPLDVSNLNLDEIGKSSDHTHS
jgi:hypothetical protein